MGIILALVLTSIVSALGGAFLVAQAIGFNGVIRVGQQDIVFVITPPNRKLLMVRRKGEYSNIFLLTAHMDDIVIVNGAICKELMC